MAQPSTELHEKLGSLDSAVKSSDSDVEVVGEKGYSSEKSSQLEASTLEEDEVTYVNGEPVITTGRDVSRFLVDVRDDGDPALTFRSFVLGTVFAGLGASLVQVRYLLTIDIRCYSTSFRSISSNLCKCPYRLCFFCS